MTTRRLGARLLMLGWCLGIMTVGMARATNAQPITVTNTNDDGSSGSLRQAIANATSGDTIDLTGLAGTIELDFGELVIDKNLTIKGPGPTLLTVSGKLASRVFRVAPGVTAVLDGLQVSDGNGAGGSTYPSHGGGILNEGSLSLFNVVVSNNHATLQSGGGGIFSDGGLSINRSTVVNNTARSGGGIYQLRDSLNVRDSTIAGNSAEGASAGGIFVEGSSVTMIVGSTISNNTATSAGGGLRVLGTTTLVNSTVSGNQASRGGGVAKDNDEPLTLINTTVVGNTATILGGGIYSEVDFDPMVLTNTIVAGNLPDDVPRPAISNNSLVGGDVATILDQTLADNGGPTPTHALVPSSPAIGAGDNTLLPADTLDLDNDGNTTEPVPVDQRGLGFRRIAGFKVDIGAVEAVCAAIVLTRSPPPAPPSVGVPYTETFDANGGAGPYSFAATGLPGGLTLSTTGALNGTPNKSGTFTVTVAGTDAYGCIGTLTYTVTIADPSCGIVIGPATLKTPYLATLYYQPLSVMPSGQYTVTVSAGALPQGVYLFAIGHHWLLGGIPSKPGEYTFTLAVKKKNSPCAPTRTFTVIVPATVLPQLTCVAKTGGKQYTARFGYDNSTDAAVATPVGADNYFTPGAQGRGQVTTFQKGRVTNAFSVVFTVKNNHTDLALWYLRGPDNVRRPVNITTATSRCP